MAYIFTNPNPAGRLVGDCVIRANSIILDQSWDKTYKDLVTAGFHVKDMPSSNSIWESYLKHNGFRKRVLPDHCPDCYTVNDFCADHPIGDYVVATGSHVVAVIDGNIYDAWPSGMEVPAYYLERK